MIALDHQSPIRKWRESHNLTVVQLATASNIPGQEVIQVEEGKTGIPGELQDYLTGQGENVSWMASEQSAFIVQQKRLWQ